MEKMLMTQALDERDLLVKKIRDKIMSARFVDTLKNNETQVRETRLSKEEFAVKAQASWQQVNDLISRYERLDGAILASNATTYIETAIGKISVAAAIALRSRLNGKGAYKADGCFEDLLLERLNTQFREATRLAEISNSRLKDSAEQMRLTILGKESKGKEDTPLAVVDAYLKENTVEVYDPIKVTDKAEAMKEQRAELLSQLDTLIKVSNATTFVEF